VPVGTIYRYFPTKGALIDAAAWIPSEHARSTRPAMLSSDDFPEYLSTLWRGFAANLPLLRRQAASAVGREMRKARLAPGRQELAVELERRGIPASSPEAERLIALCLLLAGSLAFLELHDRQGLTVEESVDVVWWAVQMLFD